jgi:hypothetical protein
MSDHIFTFPEMPAYKGYWQSVYFEPIIGSGERITVGVLAVGDFGDAKVVRAMRSELFECLYGINAPKIINMIDLVISSIENELTKYKTLEQWHSPIGGINLGKETLACDVDLNAILRQGLRFTASLSALSIDAEREDSYEVQPKRYTSQFSSNIKGQLKLIDPRLTNSFNLKIKISGSDALTTYGFMNDRYVTNFGLLVPSRLSASMNIIKAKIYDVEALKKSNYYLQPERFEIIIGTPSFDDPTLSDASILRLKNSLELVEEIADKDEINIFRATDPLSAAQHVAKYAA